MTDFQPGLDAVDGRNPIYRAGAGVYNVIEAANEIDQRVGLHNHTANDHGAHAIYSNELIFVRKDKNPAFASRGPSKTHEVEVFANFIGLVDNPDDTHKIAKCVGVARNRPKDQDMEGRERGRRFVCLHKGQTTIQLRTACPVGPGALLYWIAAGSVNQDPRNRGRILPLHGVYDPVTDGITARRFHQEIFERLTGQMDTSLSIGKTRKNKTTGVETVFQALRYIGFISACQSQKHLSGGVELTSEQKRAIARSLGLLDNDAKSAEIALEFNDMLFQYTNREGVSQPDTSHLLFPLRHVATVNIGASADTNLARGQANVFQRLTTGLAAADDKRKRIFAKTNSTGKPSCDVDVELFVDKV